MWGGLLPIDAFVDDNKITRMVEIKSYSPRHHMEMLLEPKAEHKERYQIAAAMVVAPTIQMGALVFYNPAAIKQIGVEVYKREELEDEIADVEEIINLYQSTKAVMEKVDAFPSQYTEDDIYKIYVREREDVMNLVNQRRD